MMRQERTSLFRKLAIYGFELVEGSHNFIALLEFDITNLRKRLRDERIKGRGGSLFAFILKAIGKCLKEFPEFNSMVNSKRTSYFDEVDINIPIEVEQDGKVYTKQYIIKDINNKRIEEVDREIMISKTVSIDEKGYVFSSALRGILDFLPRKLVLLLYRIILRRHDRVKRLSGTVFVTSVSMFSSVPGSIIPYAGGPKAVSFAVGSATKKPIVKGNEICIREMLGLTAIFNHDAVDGAPAARFINRLRIYLEASFEELL